MKIDGILNILKPPGMTSFDVIAHTRKLTGQKRIGHSGTLDPEACGVLPTYFGNACGAIEFSMEHDKTYRAEMILGIETDTQDITGNVISFSDNEVDNETIINAINELKGIHMQLPPMYSAIKINGEKLCDAARKGKKIERVPRKIEIYKSTFINIFNDKFCVNDKEITIKKILFEVSCSKGTYIRTICNDIGIALKSYGCLSFLSRTQVGEFNIANAITVEELENSTEQQTLHKLLKSAETIFEKFPAFILNVDDEKKYLNGMTIKITNDTNYYNEKFTRVYKPNGEFLSLGEIKFSETGLWVKSKKFFK